MMPVLGYIYLGLLVVLASIVAYEDYTIGKVRNKWIVRGLALTLAGYVLLFINTLAGSLGMVNSYLRFQFYPAVVIHVVLSFAAGVVMWQMRVWPAGDAKFFGVLACFIPLVELIRIGERMRTFPYLLFLQVLINIFVLAAVYVLMTVLASGLKGIARWRSPGDVTNALGSMKKVVTEKWVEMLSIKARVARLALNIGMLFLARISLLNSMGGRISSLVSNPALIYVLLFLLWDKIDDFMNRKSLSIGLLAVLGVYLSAGYLYFPEEVLGEIKNSVLCVAGFGVFFIMTRAVLEVYLEKRSAFEVDAGGVRPGMILSKEATATLKRDPVFFEKHFKLLYKDGLSPKQVEALRQWLWGLPKDKAKISMLSGNPFALWIFAGTLFTLAFKLDIASILFSLVMALDL